MADIPWTWLGIRASGITAWGLLTAVVVWGILLKTQVLGRLAPPMKLLDLHRWLGVTAIAFLLVHLGLLIIDPAVTFTPLQILVPGLAPWQTTAVALGTVAFWLLLPVSFLGRLRAKMGATGNRWFKRSHLIAYAAWPLATAHYVLAGTDALSEWSLGLIFAGTALIVMGLLARGFVPAPGPTRTVVDSTPLTSA
jgi:sulfoxide reductase heme-binding subunit YedZ